MSQIDAGPVKRLIEKLETLAKIFREAASGSGANKRTKIKEFIFNKLEEYRTRTIVISITLLILIALGLIPFGEEETYWLEPFVELPFVHTLIVSVLFLYLLLSKIYTQAKFELTKPDSEYFHLESYKEERGMEYSAFYPIVKQPDILVSVQTEYEKLKHANRKLKEELVSLEKENLQFNLDAKKDLDYTKDEKRNIENSFDTLYTFLINININFFTLIKDKQTFHAIHLNFPYVLYQQVEDKLLYVADHGRSGVPHEQEISLSLEQHILVRALFEKDSLHDGEQLVWKATFDDETNWVLCIYTNNNWVGELLSQGESAKLQVGEIISMFQIIVELNHKLSELRSGNNVN